MFTRRQTLALLAAAGTIPVLASCGPNASTGGGEDSGTVRIYWWGGDLRQTMTEEALELFGAQNAEITVEPEYSEWTGYWDKLATQTAGGDMPDQIGRAHV